MTNLSLQSLSDIVRQERVDAVQSFGFTERQARFLVHVLVHSGVFLERQYRAFAHIAHGQKTRLPAQARPPVICEGHHPGRAASGKAVPRAVQAAVSGDWRA